VCSSDLRRALGIRHERAAELVVRLERDGVIGPAGARGRRAVLIAS
jgi:hypothetical protein